MIYISYYPTYAELDEVIDRYKPKRVNIFVDLKNCISGVYLDEAAKTMLLAHDNSKQPPSDIFQSWLDFVAFHYKYMYERTVNLHLYTFADTGQSQYHDEIYKDYKASRSITNYKTLSMLEKDAVKNITKKNIEVIIKSARKLHNSYGIYLSYCESDFCPHYYIEKHYNDPSILNIIYSSDRDMLQTLIFDNTIQFYRKNKENKMWIDKNNWKEKLKIEDSYNIPIENYVFMKSIMGDTGDDIPGVKGIGPKSVIKYVNDVSITNLDFLKEHIDTLSKKDSKDKKAVRILESWDEVIRNYKLVSFDALIKKINHHIIEQLENALIQEQLNFSESVSFIRNIKDKLN